MDFLQRANSEINKVVWGPGMLCLFFAVGAYFTFMSGFFPFRRFPLWIKKTILSAFFSKGRAKTPKGAISSFASVSTALGATIGTGAISGVAAAIEAGGPGAVFWMWVSASLGMMTAFAEKSLGEAYRERGKDGQWKGGPMAYMRRGAKSPLLAAIYSMLCILTSFGIGCIAQSNSIAGGFEAAFGAPKEACGIIVAIISAFVVIGGASRVSSAASILVPLMAGLYLIGGGYALWAFRGMLPGAFKLILKEAFNFRAGVSGVAGYGAIAAMRQGVARGVFANEAGLGASVMAYESAVKREPWETGMWGIFEVFFDTVAVCTITALVIISSGAYDFSQFLSNREAGIINISGTQLAGEAFSRAMPFGKGFVAASIALFAFSSIIGWCYYGESAAKGLFGKRAAKAYQAAFVLMLIPGAIGRLDFVWALSDTFNGIMALPNLLALIILRKEAIGYARKAARGD